MKRILLTLTALILGITTTQAVPLYLGDGATSDISGAFSSGPQNWNTSTVNWTPSKNPAVYQSFTSGDDIILLGESPTITVTENISAGNISRETQVDVNAGAWTLAINAGVTLTMNGTMDGIPYGLDPAFRQWNWDGPGSIGGSITLTNNSRIRIEDGINAAATGLTVISENGGDIQIYNDVGDISALTLNMSNTGGNFLLIDADSKTIAALNGNATMQDKGFAGFFTVNSLNPGAESDGSGIGSFSPDSSNIWDEDFALGTGTHTFDIDADTVEADLLNVGAGQIQFGGTLTVNLAAGTLASGQTFNLFDASTFSGSFSTLNLPTLFGALEWNLDDLTVNGSIRVAGGVVDQYTGTLFLGDGSSYTNNPATWDTTSAFWGLGPIAAESVFTNWIDSSIAVIYGNGANREVNLAASLNVIVNELEWNSTSGAISLLGDGSQTVTITNEIRTARVQVARQVNLNDITLAGQFDVQNVSRISFDGSTIVAEGTEINLLDVSDIQFTGTEPDFSDLSVQLNTIDTWVYNKSGISAVLGSLSGTGEVRMDADSPLTINNVTVGGISNSATIVANVESAGDLTLGSGTHNFSINPSTGNTDLLDAGRGTLTFGGDLMIGANNTNKVSLGQVFDLFDAAMITGSFNSVTLPESVLPTGAVWYNNLETDGSISVGTPGVTYETFNFTDFSGVSTWSSTETSTSGSLTNSQGTVLTLTLSNVSDTPTDPIWLYTTAIAGIKGINGNTRLDSFDATPGVVDTTNDDALRFELSVSGTAVDSLSLQSVLIDSYAVGEITDFTDGITSTQFLKTVASEGVVSYDDVLASLTELTLADVGTWKLEVASRDNNNDTLNTFSIDEVKFLIGYNQGTAYDAWAGGWGEDIGSEIDDFEPDGLNNLLEYALGGNPTLDDAADVNPLGAVVEENGTNYLYYVHTEHATDSTLTYTVGTKTDLVTDTTLNTGDVEPAGEGGTGTYISVTNRTVMTEAAKFIGLEVSK